MPRWEAGAEARLTKAAYELYFERGFEDVTVAEIAARAGLTKRTFFRYFTDKREVLFSGAAAFQDAVVGAVIDAPRGVAPIDAVVSALAAGGTGLTELGVGARGRQRLIKTSADLQEREMIKMAALTGAIGGALQLRKVPESAASLTAQAGVAVFQTAFERWAGREGSVDFSHLIYEALDELRSAIRPADEIPSGVPAEGASIARNMPTQPK
jgi:AcrR family transcriptional regulator